VISFDEAYALAWEHRFVGGIESISLSNALGRFLAEDIVAPFPMPRFDSSAMDGYAVGSANGPWEVSQTVAAGAKGHQLAPPEAARVLTGAPVPEGTYAVVAQEDVLISGTTLVAECKQGSHIRLRGEDIQVGHKVVAAGARMDPPKISAIAAMGRTEVQVRSVPKVALISTGNELASPGAELGEAQVYDSNRPGMEAALACFGACVRSCSVSDTLDALIAAVPDDVDLVLTTAGVSVGDYDFVRPAMAAKGFEILFSGVAMKPGKPVTLAKRGSQYWLALPGNPMSALTTFALLGSAWFGRDLKCYHSPMLHSFNRKPGREEFVPCRWGSDGVEVLTNVGSHAIAGLVEADGLVRIPADATEISAGTLMWSCLLPWRSI